MSENLISEGRLITLEGATAGSNIAAGRMICVDSGRNTLFTACRETSGFTATAKAGGRFIGILDESVSAGQEPISVWTEGVFKLQLCSASTLSATAMIGKPVYLSNSGSGNLVDCTAVTGDLAIGTIVGMPGGTEPSGAYINVKITPGAFRWGVFGVQTGTVANYFGHVYPPLT